MKAAKSLKSKEKGNPAQAIALDEGKAGRARGRLVLSFTDNDCARAAFGKLDENLKTIERKLGLDIHVQGNEVTLYGDATALTVADRVLNTLYAAAKKGATPDLLETEGILAIGRSEVVSSGDGVENDAPCKVNIAHIANRKKTIHARTPTQNRYIEALNAHDLIFGVGPAGTGKTYLAVAQAVMLLEKGLVDRIILTRPAVEAGERLGFLPGDMKEKVDPYLRPLYDALYDMMSPDKVEKAVGAGLIEIAPLAFMRGRTLARAAIILDEAQNTTSMQMKMFLTRLGDGAKMMITGDPSQVDLPAGQKSGLIEALHILEGLSEIAIVWFHEGDVVRHPLVAAIIRAYECIGAKKS
ncbi:PhoH family protein [Bartonella sp. DGB2]|uniref:PhoH family protein n=1 Tax=Bartonella sp. DGB2 TaxID=3388426 RepID=UPI00398FDB7C